MAFNILLLVGTVVLAVLQVFLLCAAGFALAHMGILNKQTRKQINQLNTTLFTPALLFTKVAFSLTANELKELWIIPVLFILVTGTSAGAAYGLGLVCHLRPTQRNFAMAAAMFMNSNSMPIALVQSLISSVSELKWTEDDNKGAMLSRALTYLVLYSTLGNIARWSFGVKILEKADDGAPNANAQNQKAKEPKDVEAPMVLVNEVPKVIDTTPTHSRSPSDASTVAVSPTNTSGPRFFLADDEDQNRAGELSRTQTLLDVNEVPRPVLSSKSSLATLAPQNFQPLTFSSSPNADKSITESEEPASTPQPPATHSRRFPQVLKRAWIGFYNFMTMPLWAAFAAIVIALIPPVQNIIANHMAPLRSALEAAGDCSIPLTLVVLGAYFYTPPPPNAPKRTLKEKTLGVFKRSPAQPEAEIEKVIPGQKRTIAVAIAGRMILCPLIMIPTMIAFVKSDVPRVFSDPIFVISNVLLSAAPVALTLAQMSTKTGASDVFEKQLSKTIFWSYCVVLTPTTIIYVVIGLILAKL